MTDTAISYENTPLNTTSKSLPLKNLQFHAANSNVPNLGTGQAPIAKASETDVLPPSTTVNLPDQNLLHPGDNCSFQATLAMMNSLQMVMWLWRAKNMGHPLTITINGSVSSATP